MNELDERDRDVLVLRFLEGRDLKEVGERLGASEDAARMRVSRALDKLRTFFKKRGLTVSTASLAAFLTAHSVSAAPAGLAATIASTALIIGKNSVTPFIKIMKYTEGAFRDWGYASAERLFGDKVYTWAQYNRTKKSKGEAAANEEQRAALKSGALLIKDAIADIALQQVLTRPEDFDVIATLNLNGDYLSDALAAQVGGIGIAPGGNINYTTGHAIFEATHGF